MKTAGNKVTEISMNKDNFQQAFTEMGMKTAICSHDLGGGKPLLSFLRPIQEDRISCISIHLSFSFAVKGGSM